MRARERSSGLVVKKKAEKEETRVKSSSTMDSANEGPIVNQFTASIRTASRATPRRVLSHSLNLPVEAARAKDRAAKIKEAARSPRRRIAEIDIDATIAIFDLGSSLCSRLDPLVKEKPCSMLSP